MTQCPVSGLSVTEKDHWSFEHRQGNYTRKYSLIGTDIIHVQELADHDIAPEHLYSDDFKSLIDEENLAANPVCILLDCAPVADLKFSYKREFTNLLSTQKIDLKLIVLYNIQPSVRLQFEMLQSLATESLPVMLSGSYEEGIASILDFKSGKCTETAPDASQENAFRQVFLAEAAKMLMLNKFDEQGLLPPEDHAAYPYFQIFDVMRRDLNALDAEHQHRIERIEQEFRAILASKNSLLDDQAELVKKNEQRFREEEAAL